MMDNNNIHKASLSSTEGDSVDRVIINVGGIRFETHRATLQNISDTRLAWLTENVDPNSTKGQDWFFDRHPGAFVYILNFYRTGKLHTPADMCGPAFEEELTFWGIDEKQMEPCCWETFTRHREAEENLKNFEGPGFDDLREERRKSVRTKRNNSCLDRYYDIIWKILDDPHSSKGAKIFSLLSCFMIILSVSGYCLSTMPSLRSYDELLENINYICVVFFTIECTSRLLTTPNRKEFMFDYNNWIDFISVVPSYLVLILKEKWVKNLVIIRLLRVFKFFKLSYGLQVLFHTLKASSYELTLLLLMLFIPVVIFSSLVFAVESNLNPDGKFTSIPKTFWWCLITMTTVGYGDLTPVTWGGRMIGSVCAIFGLLTVALPISVIGGNFSLYYAHVRARLKLPQKNRRHLQVNMHGLLRQTTSLSSRDRDRKLLRRNQMAISTSSKVEAKGFLDKLFNKPQGASPKTDINVEGSPMPPRVNRGRDLRRTALINVDSSDNESNDASMYSGLLQKPGSATNLMHSPLEEKSLNDAFPPVNIFPDKRVSLARGRMRRTALINVESSDNESAESSLSNIQHRKAENTESIKCKTGNTESINDKSENTEAINCVDVVRRESNTSSNSVNQNKYDTSGVLVTNLRRDDIYEGSTDNLHAPVHGNEVRHEPVVIEDEISIFQMDPDDTQEDNGIIFETHQHDEDKEDCIIFETGSRENLKELLLVNLDKLKTFNRSLDDRIVFGATPNNEDMLQSSSRRNSMKLLTDCEQPEDKIQNEEELNTIQNHDHSNDVTDLVFPKRRSLPIDRKQNSKFKKNDIGEQSETKLINNINSPYENCRNENGRNQNNDMFMGNRSKNNKLKKNVSLPADVYTRENDDFSTENFITSHGKLKKFTRKTYLKNKIKSEGDFDEGDMLSPTTSIKFRSKRMRKESIV